MRIPGALLQALFPSAIWRGTADAIHLTFDDGPHPELTPRILQTLRFHGAKATFFVLGKNAAAHPEIVRQILSDGHSLGNHSFDHPLMVFRSPSFVEDQIRKTSETIEEIAGQRTTLFRPPYGYCGPLLARTARRLNHRIVFWSMDPRDWNNAASGRIANNVCRATRGSIVLLHDNDRTAPVAVAALGEVLDRLGDAFSFSALPT